jgi:hypothetical protein
MAINLGAGHAFLRQTLWGIAAVATSVALATVSAWPIYEDPRAIAVAVAGFLIGAGSILLGRRLRWRWRVTGAVAAGAYVLTVVPLAIPTSMASPRLIARGLGEGVLGIVLGWKRLLTVTIPAGHYQAVLVPFFLVVLIGTFAACALLIYARRWAPLAVVPMVTMVVYGAAFGSSATGTDTTFGPLTIPAPTHVVIGTLTLLVCATWLIGRAQIERSAALKVARSTAASARMTPQGMGLALRRNALATALAVAAVVAGLAAAPMAVHFGPRQVPRDSVDPLLVVQRQASPLSAYRAWFGASQFDQKLFIISGASGVDRIRIATLDAYDGETFHVSETGPTSRFTRQPTTQRPTVEITIGAGYSGVWVPEVSAEAGSPVFEGPRASTLAAAYYASAPLDAGVLATADTNSAFGLQAGDTYRVSADDPTVSDLPLTASGGVAFISEDQYPALAAWVKLQGLGRTVGDLAELVDRLHARGFLSHAALDSSANSAWTAALQAQGDYTFQASRSGHSLSREEELFTSLTDQERRVGPGATPDMLVAAVGDDEQFATAAALLSRYLGFESRVVVGVRVGSTTDPAGVAPCSAVCTGANVTAWAEARSAGGAWFVLDATPQFLIQPSIIRAGNVPPKNATQVDPAKSGALEPPQALSENSLSSRNNTDPTQPGNNLFLTILVGVLTGTIGVGLALVPFLVFPLAKVLRRRWRRTSPVPEVAMVGAWEELIAGYVDAGLEVPRRLTRAETADVIDRPAASALATVVDSAVFAEHPPGREASAQAWAILDEERVQVLAEGTFRRRVRALVSPASLLWELRAGTKPTVATLLRRKDHS